MDDSEQKPHATLQRPSTFAILGNTLRAALIIAIVVASWYAYRSVSGLFQEWGNVARPVTHKQRTVAELDPLAAVLPLAGQWSFADLDWDVQSRTVGPDEVDAQLDALAVTSAEPTGVAELPDISADLIQYAELLQMKPIEQNGNRIYRLNRSNLKGQLVVRYQAGQAQAVALAAAYPQSNEEWQLLVLSPRSASTNTATKHATLLPLPTGARFRGGRFSGDGQPLLELISLESTADELISTWRNAGWEVRPSGMGGANDFSYLCARGQQVIYAWSADGRDSLQNLLLVRTEGEPANAP